LVILWVNLSEKKYTEQHLHGENLTFQVLRFLKPKSKLHSFEPLFLIDQENKSLIERKSKHTAHRDDAAFCLKLWENHKNFFALLSDKLPLLRSLAFCQNDEITTRIITVIFIVSSGRNYESRQRRREETREVVSSLFKSQP